MSIESTKALHSRLFTVVGDELSDAEMAAISGGKHEFQQFTKTVSKNVKHAANTVASSLKSFFS